jgi:hypothetical protein
MKWSYVDGVIFKGNRVDVDVIAVPLLSDVRSLALASITLRIDRKQMVERGIDRAVELVYPEIHGTTAKLEDGF